MFRDKMPITPMHEIAHRIETFWIINCEHKRFYWKWVGHTAVIWKDPNGLLWVYESTQMSHSGIKGVQLTPLIEWRLKYPGVVKIKPVTITNPKMKSTAFSLAEKHIKIHLGKPYTDPKTPKGFKMLVRSVWDSSRFKKASTNIDTEVWFFCTMLVLNLFRFCCLIYRDINCSEWEPDNTRDKPRGRLETVTNNYVRIDPEIRIK